MKKTFADLCLERASAATPGPWVEDDGQVIIGDGFGFASQPAQYGPEYGQAGDADLDAEFIAASRTDIVILAERLKIAIRYIREASKGHFDQALADELEAIPEGDK